MGHHHGTARNDGQAKPGRPDKEADPVCGMTVDTATAKTSVHDGRTYYFCSADCRDRFEASPSTFLNAQKGTLSMKEDSHAAHHH
jgi:YHS domain-containing protein